MCNSNTTWRMSRRRQLPQDMVRHYLTDNILTDRWRYYLVSEFYTKNQSPCFRSGALSYRGWSGESQGRHSEPEAHSLSTLTLKVHFVEFLNQWSVPRGNELWIPTPFNPHLTSDSLLIQNFQSAVKMIFSLRSVCEWQGLFCWDTSVGDHE